MSRQASVLLFEDDGRRDDQMPIGGIWYKPPLDFNLHYDTYRQRAEFIVSLLPGLTPAASRSDAGPKIAVIGCGYGLLLWHLWDMGFSAWGMDNAWVQGRARAGGKLPNISDHVLVGNATVQADVRNFRSQSGIGQNQRFAALITEDVLNVADTQAEAQTMLTRLRADAMPTDRSRVIHLMTMYDPTQPWSGGMTPELAAQQLLLTEAEWVTLIGTTAPNNAERIVNLAGYRIVR